MGRLWLLYGHQNHGHWRAGHWEVGTLGCTGKLWQWGKWERHWGDWGALESCNREEWEHWEMGKTLGSGALGSGLKEVGSSLPVVQKEKV